jgi:hypothetical protein
MTQRGRKRDAESDLVTFGANQHKGGDGRREKGETRRITGLGKPPASVKAKTRATG